MGGRGSSSGISDKGKKYGTEYHTVYQSGNIKFIKINEGNITPPFETMTKGRVYVTVSNQDKPKSIVYFDKHSKRYKQVDIDHPHRINGKWTQPHTHKGYFHNEKGDREIMPKESKMIDRVLKTWYNKNGK